MKEENTESEQKAKSFTTRVSGNTWTKINTYKEYGKWNTNQFTNHALDAFFEIIESDEENPKLPLVCETLRDLRKKNRSRLVAETPVVQTSGADVVQSHDLPEDDHREEKSPQKETMRERMDKVDKPWLENSED
jgi:hypothetical protein